MSALINTALLRPHLPMSMTLSPLQAPITAVFTTLGVISLGILPNPVAAQPLNPEIKVGIIQRFGSEADDTIEIKAPAGDQLTVVMQRADGGVDNLTTNQLSLDIQQRPLEAPELYERLVLSTHRSFESAEDSANQWRAKGIAVEMAQPKGWQVWAKRDVYHTPLLRRLLLDSITQQGISGPYLDSKVLETAPQASAVANYYRYSRDEIEISSGGRTVLVNGVPYPGDLRLQPNSYGTYTLVNNVEIEDYLRGVVPHEIGPSAPQTAVEAQTVLARTYALRNLRRFEVDDYEMCATTQCQVYFGWKDNLPRADQAIAATRGQVLTYNNELIDAVYSSTTGGVTAAFTDVWNGAPRPYLQPVVDSVQGAWSLASRDLSNEQNFRQFINLRQGFNEDGWKYFRWTTKSSLPDLNKELRKYLEGKQHPLADFDTIQSIQVLKRAKGGRIQQLQVVTDRGDIVLVKDEMIRAFEAPNSLLSYLEPLVDGNKRLTGYKFIGGGLGHGVGMSQTGSYNLSRLGWSHSRILNFYYPNTQLQPLNPSISYWTNPTPTVAPVAPTAEAPAAEPAPASVAAPTTPSQPSLPAPPKLPPQVQPPSGQATVTDPATIPIPGQQ